MKRPDQQEDLPEAATDLKGEAAPPVEGCRTSPYLESFSRCLVEHPDCKNARPFGYRLFCTHPEHKKFWEYRSR